MSKLPALCILSTTPYYQEWISKGYTKKDIYTSYVLNNFVLQDVPVSVKNTVEAKKIIDTMVTIDDNQVDIMENLIAIGKENAFGAFYNNVFYFSKSADKGTVAEEAFHAIAQTLLSAQERNRLLSVGEHLLLNRLKQTNKSIEEYIDNLVTNLGIDKSLAKEYAFEEEIAKQFVNYYTSGRTIFTENDILKMADSLPFGEASYSISKIIYDFFKKLLSAIGFWKTNEDQIISIFDRIKNGEFKNKKINNPNNLFNIPSFQIYQRKVSDDVVTNIAPSIVSGLINNLSYTYKKYKSDYNLSNDDTIKLAFKTWREYSQYLGNMDEISLLTNIDALKDFKAEIIKRNIAEFTQQEARELLFEDEVEDDVSYKLDNFWREANEVDFRYSKEMKLLIANSGKAVSFDNGTKIVYIVPDEDIIYSGLVRAASDVVSDSERLQKIVKFSNIPDNENSRLLVQDVILTEIVKSESTYNNEKIESLSDLITTINKADFDLEKLIIPSTFASNNLRLLLKTFDLSKRETFIMSVSNSGEENTHGTTNFTLSNQQNAEKIIIRNWQAAYNLKKSNYKNSSELFYDEDLSKVLLSNVDKEVVDSIISFTNFVGIKLHSQAVLDLKYLLSTGEPTEATASSEITIDGLKSEIKFLRDVRNKFLAKSTSNTYLDFFDEEKENTHSNKLFRKLASLQAFYDETILENSSKNIEGKTVYGYQWPTNTLRMVSLLRTKKFIEKLEQGNPYVGQSNSPDSQFFINNPISEFLIANKDNKEILRMISHYSPDGLKNIAPGEVNDDEQKVAFGSFNDREFASMTLSLFAERARDVKGTVLAPVTFGHNESSKMLDFVSTPVVKNLFDKNGVISDTGLIQLKRLIALETQRIDKSVEFITKHIPNISKGDGEAGTITGEAFQKIVGYTEDIYDGYHTGNIYIKDGVIDWDKSSKDGVPFIKSLQISKNVSQFYTLEDYKNPSNFTDEVLKERFTNIFNKQRDYVIAKLVSFKSTGKIDIQNSLLSNLYYKLPNNKPNVLDFQFTDNNKKDIEKNVGEAMMSMWLNSSYLNFIRTGDPMLNYKNNLSDPLKRNKIDNGSGTSIQSSIVNPKFGITKAIKDLKIVIAKEPKTVSDIDGFKFDKDGKIVKKASQDVADAQGTGSVLLHLKTDFGSGKLRTEEQYNLFRKFYEGIDTSVKEHKAADYWLNVKKTVTANGNLKGKFSMRTLNKPQTAYKTVITAERFFNYAVINPESRLTEQLVNPVDGSVANVEVSHDIITNKDGQQEYVYYEWNKLAGTKDSSIERLHGERMLLDGWRLINDEWVFKNTPIDFIMYPTAAKSTNRNVLYTHKDIKDDYHVQIHDALSYKIQVENPAGKTAIYDPTQNIEISINEITGNIDIEKNGKFIPVPAKELISDYQKMLASRVGNSYKIAEKEIFDSNNNPDFSSFLERVKETLIQTGADKQTIDLLEAEGKAVKYNQNNPLIKEKFVQIYMKNFSSGVMMQKIPGDAMAMISPSGYTQLKRIVKKEVEFKGKKHVIYTWEVIKKSDPKYTEYLTEYNKTNYDTTDLVYDIRNTLVGDNKNDELSKRLAEIYVEGKDVFFTDDVRHNKPRIENGKITHFVSETLMPKWTDNPLSESFRYQFGVRIPTQDKQSSVNIEWVDELPTAMGNSIVVPKEVAQLAGSDFDIDKIYVHRFETKLSGKYAKLYNNSFADYVKYTFTSNPYLGKEMNNFIKKDSVLLEYAEKLDELEKIIEEKKQLLDFYFSELSPEIKTYWNRIKEINKKIDSILEESADTYMELSALNKDIPKEIIDLQVQKKSVLQKLSEARKAKNKSLIEELEGTSVTIANLISQEFRDFYKKNPSKSSRKGQTLASTLNQNKQLVSSLRQEKLDIQKSLDTIQEVNKETLENVNTFFSSIERSKILRVNIDFAKTQKQTELLQSIGAPATPEEYEAQMPKGHNGYLNNEILKTKMAVLSSNDILFTYGDRGIYDSPATIDKLTNLSKEYYVIANDTILEQQRGKRYIEGNKIYPFLTTNKESIFDTERTPKQTFSLLNYMEYQEATQVGKGAIGIAVNANLLGIVANRIELEHIQPVVSFNFSNEAFLLNKFRPEVKSYQDLTKAEQRVFDFLSTLITAATDEAKEAQLARHGINTNGFKILSILLLHGLSLGHGIALLQNNFVKKYESMIKPSGIKTAGEKYVQSRKTDNFKDYLKITKEQHPAFLATRKNPYSYELKDTVLFFDQNDRHTFATYLFLLDSYDNLSNLIPMIKGKRGLDKDIDSVFKAIDVTNTVFDSDANNLYNFSKVINEDNAADMLQYADIYNDQDAKIKRVFTEGTEIHQAVKYNLFSNVSRNLFNFKQDANRIADTILTGYIIQTQKDLALSILSPEKLNNDLLLGKDSVAKKILKAEKTLKDKIIADFKVVEKTDSYKNKRKYFDIISILGTTRLTPEKESKLIDLISIIKDENPELANDIFRYYVIKDSFKFKSNTIGKAMPAFYFKELATVLNYAQTKNLSDNVSEALLHQFLINNVYSDINFKQYLTKQKEEESWAAFFGLPDDKFEMVSDGKSSNIGILVYGFTPLDAFVDNQNQLYVKDLNYKQDGGTLYLKSVTKGAADIDAMFGASSFVSFEDLNTGTYNRLVDTYTALSKDSGYLAFKDVFEAKRVEILSLHPDQIIKQKRQFLLPRNSYTGQKLSQVLENYDISEVKKKTAILGTNPLEFFTKRYISGSYFNNNPSNYIWQLNKFNLYDLIDKSDRYNLDEETGELTEKYIVENVSHLDGYQYKVEFVEKKEVIKSENMTDGFKGYVGGFENIGKGTIEGDSKDKAMREVADSAIVELSSNKDSSSKTSLGKLGLPKEGDKIIMLARNGTLSGKNLREETKEQIREAKLDGAEFVVGDMPNVDSQFISYLQEIGAKFTIYHTGNNPRIVLQEKTINNKELSIVDNIYSELGDKTQSKYVILPKDKFESKSIPKQINQDEIPNEIDNQNAQYRQALSETYQSNPRFIIVNNLPLITPESATKETGTKVGVKQDINPSWLSKDKGMTVQQASERLLSDFESELNGWSEQDIRDYIIEILMKKKKDVIDQLQGKDSNTTCEGGASI